MVWLDSLDVPLVMGMDATFFEPGPGGDFPELPADAAFAAAGLVPAGTMTTDARAALAQTPADDDGARRMRYVNPATGGPVLSRLDCYLLGLDRGKPMRRFRTTSNAVCFVVEGEGASSVGDIAVAWRENDIFTLPHWSWTSYTASSETAAIFQSTDREVMNRLGLLYEERE